MPTLPWVRFRFRVTLLLVLGCLLFLAQPAAIARAAGQVIRVKRFSAEITSPCGNLPDWSNACDLLYALTTEAVPGDEIWVAANTYVPSYTGDLNATFQLRNGIALYGGFAGTETARDQRDWVAHSTTLSGINYFYHVVTGSGTDSTAVLDGFTISAGKANDCGSGMINFGGSPTLTNIIFTSNSAPNSGGAICNLGGSPTLTNVTFTNNSSSSSGGGMYTGGGNPTLTNVTFTGNSASLSGGGMDNYGGSPTLTNVTFSNNSASYFGGGMSNFSGSPTLTNVTFTGNSASINSGGMDNYGGSPTLTNVTFSNNSASAYGGGMSNESSNPTIRNSIFWQPGETATFDHLRSSNPTIRNSIFWGNTARIQSQIYNGSGTPSISASVVQGGCPSGSNCTNIIATDPRLGTLGNWGGSTQTIPLLPGSSAIDAGNDTICLVSDQRGFARYGAHCDIGAFESRGFTLTKTGGDNQSTPINLAFTSALTLTVSSPYSEPVNGGVILFNAPASGASTNPTSRTITIASGAVTTNFSANDTVGAYAVNATTGNTTVSFGLANLKGNTSPTIASSANPSLLGSTVTFTVTVTSPSGGTPSGTVDFFETTSPTAPVRAPGKALASQTLVNGRTTFTASALAVGTHNLLAIYSGDANYNAGTSAVYSQVVNYLTRYFYLPWLSK